MINCKRRMFKTLILFSVLLLPTSTEVSAQSNLPGYMKPFGIPLGQPIDLNINYEWVYDPKTQAVFSKFDVTNNYIDILYFVRVSPPRPNSLFNNNSWLRDGRPNESGTWNGYTVEVSRRTNTVLGVKAEYSNVGNEPWGGKAAIKSCNRMSQVSTYFKNTYPDLLATAIFDQPLDSGHQYIWSNQSSVYTGFQVLIKCNESVKNGKKHVYASINFILHNKDLNDLRDREALDEQNSGF